MKDIPSRASGYAPGNFWSSDNLSCGICELPLSLFEKVAVKFGKVSTQNPWGFSEDHIIPKAEGGDDSFDNLRAAHIFCNEARGARELTEELSKSIREKLLAKRPLSDESELRNSMSCRVCDRTFHVSPARIELYGRVYCSRACQHRGLRKRITISCANCAIPYEEIESRKNRSRFCSKECYNQGKGRDSKDALRCQGCHKTYFLAKSNKRTMPRIFCSSCRKHS